MTPFAGDRSFPHPVAAVAAKLSDAGWLVGTLPDVQVTAAAPDRATWKMKPKLSFVTGHLDSAMDRTALDPGVAVDFRVVTKAIGASSTVHIRLAFRAADGGTAVPWTGELVDVTGLLKMVPKGLLQSTAEKVIDEVWAAVGAALARDGVTG
ncbi:MAG TPA: SRPBCC domain-containing protein [Urbifossiella sp.]|nr:SRPBCC domain-containing protein [Urbifossiella sp.]